MDWNRAIEKNREALRRILAALVAMAGLPLPLRSDLPGAEPRPTLPRYLHRAVLRLLRPAEAAARRLIIVIARDLTAKPPQPRGIQSELPASARKARSTLRQRRDIADGRRNPPALPLFDTLPRWRRRRPAAAGVPRISLPGYGVPSPVAKRCPPMAFDTVDAARLAQRLRSLAAVLDDLPAHARRFALWRARRDAVAMEQWRRGPSRKRRVIRRVSPLRPGRPPGSRGRPAHEVHELLNDLHDLAFWALTRADTS